MAVPVDIRRVTALNDDTTVVHTCFLDSWMAINVVAYATSNGIEQMQA